MWRWPHMSRATLVTPPHTPILTGDPTCQYGACFLASRLLLPGGALRFTNPRCLAASLYMERSAANLLAVLTTAAAAFFPIGASFRSAAVGRSEAKPARPGGCCCVTTLASLAEVRLHIGPSVCGCHHGRKRLRRKRGDTTGCRWDALGSRRHLAA